MELAFVVGKTGLSAPVPASHKVRSTATWFLAALGCVVAVALAFAQVPQVPVADVAAVDGCAAEELEGGAEGGPIPSAALLLPVTTAALGLLGAPKDLMVARALPDPQNAQAYARWMRTVRGAQAPPG